MTKIDLTIEDDDATEQAKQMLSGVEIEGAERVRIIVESAPVEPTIEDEDEEPEAETAGDTGN